MESPFSALVDNFVLCATELDMEDEDFRWDAVMFESLANTNATTNSATLAKKQLAESHYNNMAGSQRH